MKKNNFSGNKYKKDSGRKYVRNDHDGKTVCPYCHCNINDSLSRFHERYRNGYMVFTHSKCKTKLIWYFKKEPMLLSDARSLI